MGRAVEMFGGVFLLALAAGGQASAETRVRLQLKWLHQFQFAGYYAAEAQGYYRDEGLKVEIREGSPDRPPIAAVLRGEADVGVNGGSDILYARLAGEPILALGVVFQHSPAVVLTRKDDGLLRPSDLIGRTLMLNRGHGEVEVLAMFRREGIPFDQDPAKSVTTRQHSWRPEDLAERKVDAITAYVTTEPAVLRRRGLEVNFLRPIEYGIDFYGDTLFATEAFVSQAPEVAAKFVRASMKGWAYAMDHPEELVDLITRLESSRVPRSSREELLAEATAMRELVLPRLIELGHMNPGRWERMAFEFRALGLVSDISRASTLIYPPQADVFPRRVAVGASIAAGVSVLALLWVWQLRRQVAGRTRQLMESLETNRAILAGFPDLIFLNRRDGTYLQHHARTPEDLAVPPGKFLGKRPIDVLPPPLGEQLMAMLERAIDDQTTQILEYPLLGRTFEARVLPTGGDRALTIVREVTQEREAAARMRLLAAAIEQAAEDVIITDANRVIQFVNPSFERTTGYTSADVVGKTPSILKSGRHDGNFYQAITRSLADGLPWRGRFINRTKDGRHILQDSTIVAIRDDKGAVAGYVSVRHDVTRRVELETHIEQAHRLEAIGTLAGGIAHDFNNILGIIIGNAELGLVGQNKPTEELQSVLLAAHRAEEMVKQLLSFSRQVKVETRPVSVAVLLKESQRFLRATLPSSIELVSRVDSEAMVRADPGELQRIILNLCTNAVQAMRGHPGVLTLELSDMKVTDTAHDSIRDQLTGGPYVRLMVSDTGCGMTEEVKTRIFEPFFTTRSAGEGSGLGLSIVHGIVMRLKGAIAVESTPGQGARFEVYLPVEAGAPAEAPRERLLERGTGRVLVVDDEPLVARVLERSIAALGYEVEAYTSATDALAAVSASPIRFDAVVSDLAMPRLSGLELLKRLRSLRVDLPVVLCTGNREDLTPEAAAVLGATAVVEKPIDLPNLAGILARAVERPAAPVGVVTAASGGTSGPSA